MKKFLLLYLLWMMTIGSLWAQVVRGTVKDAVSGDPLPMVSVYDVENSKNAVQTDVNGRYTITPFGKKLRFSFIGFESKIHTIPKNRKLDVKLRETSALLQEVNVVASKPKKYSRENNPAVEMMKKVIATNQATQLRENDFLSCKKYQKLTFSFNEASVENFQEGAFKHLPVLYKYIQKHPFTGKDFLPLMMTERITRLQYRKHPKKENISVEAEQSRGLNEFLNTGDVMSALLKDCITEVDFTKDHVRLLQYPFISPLNPSLAIGFYRYYIVDTVAVDRDTCYHLAFTPNNPQDFGFSGSLYVHADSSWRLKRAVVGLPHKSDVNFVEQMDIVQNFASLPSGEQIVVDNTMIIQFKILENAQKMMVESQTHTYDYDFSPIPDEAFKSAGGEIIEPNANNLDNAFWDSLRPDSLSLAEQRIGNMISDLQTLRGFRPIMWVLRAFIENYIETTMSPNRPNLVDIGPVNTMIGSNWVEGFHLRLGAQTTANLHKRLFAKGYAKYGFGDNQWKGMAALTYSFRDKKYSPSEFPVHNLFFSYANDISSPSDKFLSTDKDNVFVAWKWSPVKHMNYYDRFHLEYDREWLSGWRTTFSVCRESNTPAGELFYQPMDGMPIPSLQNMSSRLDRLRFTELSLHLQYRPGANYVNTKRRRLVTNLDAPILGLQHTVALKNLLGGDYTYHFTEASAFKRYWVPAWGKVDILLKGGIQWSKVPFPFLITPAANLSYIIEPQSFRLIRNMEFFNDRYASAIVSWDMNGSLFNRIPLLRALKWREIIGCNILWGTLTDKNNPLLPKNISDASLFYFPGILDASGQYTTISHVMNPHKPYVEIVAGIHNICKIVRLEYVRRLNYHYPGVSKWGVRGSVEFSF